MSADRDFDPIVGGGAGGAYQAGDKWGFQTAEKVRQALDQALYLPHIPLGGSESSGKVTGAATWAPVPGYLPIVLNGDSLGGLTIEVVSCRLTENAAQSVQLRLRNVTDGSTAGTGTSSTSTTPAEETFPVTLASGVKTYRLEMLGGATYAVTGWGVLRLRATPA